MLDYSFGNFKLLITQSLTRVADGVAQEITGAELEQGLEVFDRVSRQDIGRAFGPDDVQGSALFRLYRATVSEHWVLIPGRDPDRGSGVDRSERVSLD